MESTNFGLFQSSPSNSTSVVAGNIYSTRLTRAKAKQQMKGVSFSQKDSKVM